MQKKLTCLSIIIGLTLGVLFSVESTAVSSAKSAYISPMQLTGRQVPLKPTWIPLAQELTDSPIESVPQTLQQDGQTGSMDLTQEQQATTSSTDHQSLMAAAGIAPSQWASAEKLVHRESSWNPTAYNAEGACSLVQALPCHKIPGDWTDPVTALTWGNKYVADRYGSWDAALAHSLAVSWY